MLVVGIVAVIAVTNHVTVAVVGAVTLRLLSVVTAVVPFQQLRSLLNNVWTPRRVGMLEHRSGFMVPRD